jgi:hypothetical protein
MLERFREQEKMLGIRNGQAFTRVSKFTLKSFVGITSSNQLCKVILEQI